MVVCVIALIVFGILGIFSATHRAVAKEAMDCVLRKMTFRPCNTGLDKRLKMIVSMKFMKHHKGLGKFVHKHFESISSALMVIFILSFLFSAIGMYNFWAYGNCNGPNSSEFCVYNPETYSNTNFLAWLFPNTPEGIKPISTEGGIMQGNQNAEIEIIEVGCFTCPFTKISEPIVKEVLEKYDGKIKFYFKYFPLPNHDYSFEASEAAECAREQEKFWEYKDLLFTRQLECTEQPNTQELNLLYKEFAKEAKLNEEQFSECLDSHKYKTEVEKHKQEAIDAGIYGTPNFFINGKALVAPKNAEEFYPLIDAELNK